MNNLALGLLGGATFFFLITTLVMIMINSSKNKKRLEGLKTLVDKALEEKGPRIEQFNDVDILANSKDKKVNPDGLIEAETKFYEALCDILYEPVVTNMKKIPKLVTKLVSPYFELIEHVGNDNSGNSEELEALERRYQEKIEENEQLTERLSELKSSTQTEEASEPESPKAGGEALEFVKEMLSGLASLTETPIEFNEETSLEELKALFQNIQAVLNDKVAEGDDADQYGALITQLRQEKVDGLKKYKKAMVHLVKYFKEYATVNNIDVAVDESIEIEEFEKVAGA